MRYRALPAATLAVCLCCANTASANVVVDGDLTDWGISFNNDLADYGTMSGHGSASVNGRSFQYHEEDQSDSAGFSGYLGPNNGGQNYDSEFMGVGIDGANLVIAILTGQRPDNVFEQFLPGDIRIQTATNEWLGIEVGGGPGGNPNASGQITEGAPGTTYDVDSLGLSRHITLHEAPLSDQLAGSVWSDTTWVEDPVGGPGPSIDPQMISGTYLGMADYIYRWDAGSNHAVIEMSINRSLFEDVDITGIEWTPGCGNDILHVALERTPEDIPHAPEPTSFVLLALGTFGMLLGRIRQRIYQLGSADGSAE